MIISHQISGNAPSPVLSLPQLVEYIDVQGGETRLRVPSVSTFGNLQMFGHTKHMAENPIHFIWGRPEIEVLVLYLVVIDLHCRLVGLGICL